MQVQAESVANESSSALTDSSAWSYGASEVYTQSLPPAATSRPIQATANLLHELQERDLDRWNITRRCREHLFGNLLTVLKEREFAGRQWKSLDKAFACAWLNSEEVVIGTKCNNLLLLQTSPTPACHTDPLEKVPLPQLPPRPSPAAADGQNQDYMVRPSLAAQTQALWRVQASNRSQQPGASSSGPTSTAASVADEEDRDTLVASMIARAISTREPGLPDTLQPPPQPGEFTIAQQGIQVSNCGIHCIALSPGKTLLACGGAHPSDCQIFSVQERPSASSQLIPMQTLVGHSDWIFGCAWVTDCHVVTGSRDACLKLWEVGADVGPVNPSPLQTTTGQEEKVRDVKYLSQLQQVASLAVDGSVQLWDPHLNAIHTVKTQYKREVVCMAASESLLAVGSQNHVTFIDPRQKAPMYSLANLEHNHGVRSLAFSHHVVSIGGGQGRLHFWDMRAGKYMNLSSVKSHTKRHLQTGAGYLVQNEVYMNHFEGMEVRNACYAHAWDPSETKLMTVGGPLAFGLTGTYAAIWE